MNRKFLLLTLIAVLLVFLSAGLPQSHVAALAVGGVDRRNGLDVATLGIELDSPSSLPLQEKLKERGMADAAGLHEGAAASVSRAAMSATSAVPTAASSPALHASAVFTETTISYTYDFAGRLLGATRVVTITTDGTPQVVVETIRFTYDALGRPVTRQTENGSERYLYAGGQVVEERDSTDAVQATYVGVLTMERGAERRFYQTDAAGSVRGLADATGAVTEQVDYDPFGAPAFSSGGQESAFGNPFLFRGRRYDADSGLYVYGGRRYEPATGRFQQRGSEALGNPYTFAGNNPASPR